MKPEKFTGYELRHLVLVAQPLPGNMNTMTFKEPQKQPEDTQNNFYYMKKNQYWNIRECDANQIKQEIVLIGELWGLNMQCSITG